MRFLLDTCALLDANDANISKFLPIKIRRLLLSDDNELLMSAVSVTEMVTKTAIGKLNVGYHELSGMIVNLKLLNLSYTVAHASRLYSLPQHHRDPFDRMLIATALEEHVAVVSSDSDFSKYIPSGLVVIEYRVGSRETSG